MEPTRSPDAPAAALVADSPSSPARSRIAKVEKMDGKCDVCEQIDGFRGLNMQQCRECHVRVHEGCYGLVPTDSKDPNFVCHACKAVGEDIEVNHPSKVGGTGSKMGKERRTLKQEQRPTECVLCSHKTGIHAMHPLYDTHGKEGRQLVLPGKGDGEGRLEKRPAWVHTLCAAFICSHPKTAGCVYGCFKDGSYDGVGNDEASLQSEFSFECNDEDGSGKLGCMEAEESDSDDGVTVQQVHHYAIASKDDGEETVWTRAIKAHCKELKCFLCGKGNGKYRIPVQCIAGDENEIDAFKQRHSNLNVYCGTECSVAMHVGCAAWGSNHKSDDDHVEIVNGRRCRLCYFTPGDDGHYGVNKPITHSYCKVHSRDLIVNNPQFAKPPQVESAGSRSPILPKLEDLPDYRSRVLTPCRESPERSVSGPSQSPRTTARPSLNRTERVAMNRIKPRNRQSRPPEPIFGATFGRRSPPICAGRASTEHFPTRGRSARALTGSPSTPEVSSSLSTRLPFGPTSNTGTLQPRVSAGHSPARGRAALAVTSSLTAQLPFRPTSNTKIDRAGGRVEIGKAAQGSPARQNISGNMSTPGANGGSKRLKREF